MKKLYFLLFSLLSITSFGQVQQGKYLTTGTLRIRNFYVPGDDYKTIQIAIENKTGRFITKSIVIGLKTDYTWTHKKTKRYGTIQTGGSQWYEKGVYKRHEYAVGAFADKYFQLSKKLYLTAGLYAQYYSYYEKEVGDYYDPAGNFAGVSYEMRSFPNKVAQLGLSNSLIYFLNERFGINCLVSSLDVSINHRNPRGAEFDFRTPIMNLGLQYHFPR